MSDLCSSALNLAIFTAESQENWELVLDLLQAKQNEARRRHSETATRRDAEDRTNAAA
jgi:hypothetical protein